MEVLHNLLAAPQDGFLGCKTPIGLHAELERREQRVGDFVCGEEDEGIFVEALRDQVAESVVLFVEGEEGGVGGAWIKILEGGLDHLSGG